MAYLMEYPPGTVNSALSTRNNHHLQIISLCFASTGEKSCLWENGLVIAEILEVASNPNLNNNRGSTVRGDRWFELHVIEYQSRFNDP